MSIKIEIKKKKKGEGIIRFGIDSIFLKVNASGVTWLHLSLWRQSGKDK